MVIFDALVGRDDILVSTTYFGTLDFFFCICIIFFVYLIMFKNNFRGYSKSKKMLFKLISVLFFILMVGAEKGYLIKKYYFSTSDSACSYSELCNIKSLLKFEKDNYAVYIDGLSSIAYYEKDDKGWRINNKFYKSKYNFKHDGVDLRIYFMDDRYFIYMITDGNININEIKDNTEKAFESLMIADYPYYVKDRYGKIVDSIDDYTIVINYKDFNIKDF